MAQPTPYVPTFDFTDFQTANPSDPLPAGDLDVQLNLISTFTQQVAANLAKIQRDDGALANLSVGIDQLKPEVDIGINTVSDWVTGFDYVVRDAVYQGTGVYRCIVSHTSDNFATDLAAGRWQLVINLDLTGDAAAAIAAAAAAEASALAAASTVVQGGLYAAEAETVSQVLAMRWLFSNSTTMADPTSTFARINNATYASASALAVSCVSNNSGTPNIRAFLQGWGDSTSTVRGYLVLRSLDTPTTFAIYNINGSITDNTTWVEIPVSHVAGNGTFANNEPFSMAFSRNGDGGTLGSAIISSNSSSAFAVGPNGDTNPVVRVDGSVASSVNGMVIRGAASGGRASITAISPDTDAGIDIVAKGSSLARLVSPAGGFSQLVSGNSTLQLSDTGLVLQNSFRSFTANDFVSVTAVATSSIPASTEMVGARFDFGAIQTHQTGNYTTQRDMIFNPATHAAAGASVITNAMGLFIGGAPRGGANVTMTNSSALHIGSVNVSNSGTVTNSFAGIFNAMTGATTNYGISVLGGVSLFAPSAAGYASLNVAEGTAPSSPIAGDLWRTSAGWKIRHGSVTFDLGNYKDCFCGEIDTALNRDYVFCLEAPYALTITRFVTQSASGTCTAALKNAAGTVATNSVSTTKVSNTTLTSPTVAAGEKVFITVSANSAARAIAFVVDFTRAS